MKKIVPCHQHQTEHGVNTFMRIFPILPKMEVQEIVKQDADYFKFNIKNIDTKFIPFQVKILN